MSAGDVIQDVVGVFTIIGLVFAAARLIWRWLQKSKQREIDDRVTAVLERRAKDQEDGTPVEKELRRQLGELKQELADVRAQHRQEIADLRDEHGRELDDVRHELSTEINVLRSQLGARPTTGGTA